MLVKRLSAQGKLRLPVFLFVQQRWGLGERFLPYNNLTSKARLGAWACVQLHLCQVLLRLVASCQGVIFHTEDAIPSSLAEEE